MPHTGMIRTDASAARLSFGSGPALANVPEAARARRHDRRAPVRSRRGDRSAEVTPCPQGGPAPRALGLAAALVPVVALVGLLGLSFFLFGDAAAVGAEPGGARLLLDRGDRRRLAARALDRRPARRRGRQRHRRAAGDLHSAVGRRADRHLGAQRHADRHGLLRAAAAQPRLLLPDRLPDLPRRRRVDRQLLDRRRHPRHRPDGGRPRDGARSRRSPPARSSPAPTSATSSRRSPAPPTSPAPPPGPTSTSTSASRSGPPCPRSLVALVLFWSLGSPVEFDPAGVTARIEAAFQPSLDPLRSAGARARARDHALAALRRHLPRRARRRRPGRRGRAGPGRRLRRGGPARTASRS